jgi:hypothetical protein
MNSSLDVRDHREQIGLDVEAAAGDTSKIDLIWVPGEGSSTGSVTGGRKFARHHFASCHSRASADRVLASERVSARRMGLQDYFSTTGAHRPNQQTISKPAPYTEHLPFRIFLFFTISAYYKVLSLLIRRFLDGQEIEAPPMVNS